MCIRDRCSLNVGASSSYTWLSSFWRSTTGQALAQIGITSVINRRWASDSPTGSWPRMGAA
eukprot:13888525-Alexandrium_andersonii.AAC.1